MVNSDNQVDTKALQDFIDIAQTTSNNKGYELTFAGKGIARTKADSETAFELKFEPTQSKIPHQVRNDNWKSKGGLKPAPTTNTQGHCGLKPAPITNTQGHCGLKPASTINKQGHCGLKPASTINKQGHCGLKPASTINKQGHCGLDPQSQLDIGYKVFSLTQKPKLAEQGGLFRLVNERKTTADTLYNMLAVLVNPCIHLCKN